MAVYLTGDTHGNVLERFSFSQHNDMRNLTKDDMVFILGDFGVIWSKEQDKEEKYQLDWLASKPWTTIAITGNHENYDRILSFPRVEKFGGQVRDIGYENIFLVSDITILDIEDQHILCLPRAESHDIYPLLDSRADWYDLRTGYSNLVDPANDLDGSKRYKMRQDGLYYRVIGESWWPQEKIPMEEYMDFLEPHENEHFDLILSHDAPGCVNDYLYSRERPNEGQRYFDMLKDTLDFDYWYHGHFHFNQPWGKKMYCLYEDILKV